MNECFYAEYKTSLIAIRSGMRDFWEFVFDHAMFGKD